MPAHLRNRLSKGRAESVPIVFLTGGLGNQLFQIAHSKYVFGQQLVELDWRIGRPRLNDFGMPEIAEFNLGENFVFSQKTVLKDRYLKPSQPLRFVYNLYLRNSVSSYPKIIQRVTNFVCHLLWPIAGFIYCHETLFLTPTNRLPRVKRPCLAGYFQNPNWLNNETLREDLMHLKVDSDVVRSFEKYAALEKPLCVHMRMTDYRSDPNIGMIEEHYFIQQIRKELQKKPYGKIWLFSDEPAVAIKSLKEFSDKIRLIENNLSSAVTLELMKLCEGFIISNSTFSWWGAYLSKADPMNITAPYPWFKGQKSPERLLPVSWQKSDPWH